MPAMDCRDGKVILAFSTVGRRSAGFAVLAARSISKVQQLLNTPVSSYTLMFLNSPSQMRVWFRNYGRAVTQIYQIHQSAAQQND